VKGKFLIRKLVSHCLGRVSVSIGKSQRAEQLPHLNDECGKNTDSRVRVPWPRPGWRHTRREGVKRDDVREEESLDTESGQVECWEEVPRETSKQRQASSPANSPGALVGGERASVGGSGPGYRLHDQGRSG
jgi:hypothetical protein